MKAATFLLIATILAATAVGQSTNAKYDSALAHKLGADDYGMKNYVFVILKPGDNKSTDKQLQDSCFEGHLKNIQRLAAQRQLIVAGLLVKMTMITAASSCSMFLRLMKPVSCWRAIRLSINIFFLQIFIHGMDRLRCRNTWRLQIKYGRRILVIELISVCCHATEPGGKWLGGIKLIYYYS